MANSSLSKCLSTFSPISLDEMSAVKLMNRVDTKFVCPLHRLPEVLEMAEKEYYVQEINGIRIAEYDTVYYDTDDLDMYIRHHDRQLARKKVRIRQYVDTGDVFLEVKRKNNKGRTKKKRIVLAVNPNSIGENPNCGAGMEKLALWQSQQQEISAFIAERTPYRWEELQPKLRTAFHRITLVNKGKTERLTIDFDLRFSPISTGFSVAPDNFAIIELKRDGCCPSPMLGILDTLRVKPMKVSKYCVGTAMTNPEAKQNRFKIKIRKITKICTYA